MKINLRLPRLWMKLTGVSIGKKLKCFGWPIVVKYPNGKISIGNDCAFCSNLFSNLLGLFQRTIIVARPNSHVNIGNGVGVSGSTIYAREYIEIGDKTLIGANCKIIDNDFHNLDPSERNNFDILKTKPVIIGKNVFVGCNSIILKGTKLGNNCVVGAGSVVHGEFADNQIIAGNPAKVIGVVDLKNK